MANTKKNDRSKLDEVQQRRNAYLPCENAAGTIQVNNLVPAKYSRLDLTYNVCGCVTKIIYFCDDIQEQNEVLTVKDTCDSLNSKYFILFSARDKTKYHIWYDVDGAGTDPAPPCSTGVKINLSKNDLAPVVALATKQIIDEHVDFDAILQPFSSNKLIITNEVGGIATNAVDFNSGFTFANLSEGMNRIVATLIFEYDVNANLTRVFRSTDVIDDPEANNIALDSGCMLLTCSGCCIQI